MTSSQKKTTIINIIPHGPAYHFSPDKKPDVFWEKSDGTFLGFWKREWPDLLGKAVFNETDHLAWEVWQPDYRAEKIYSKKVDEGFTHRLFPASDRYYKTGTKFKKSLFSEKIILELRNLEKDRIILNLFGTYGLHVPFYQKILETIGPGKRFPIFYIGLGMFRSPSSEILKLHRPLTYLDLIIEQYKQKRLIKFLDLISEMEDSAIKQIRRIYRGRIEKLTMGCDFNYWIPVPSMELKKSLRQKLNIPSDQTVFLATGNFQPRKQFDKLISVFRELADRNNFFLNITGHGNKNNSDIIKSYSEPLVKHKKAILHSFVSVERLRNIYWASDIYISSALEEGGPVSVMKAMACGLPVLSTQTGNTSELMKKHGAGKLLPVKNYDEWARSISSILEGDIPSPIDIEIAKTAFDWRNVAKKFISLYDQFSLSTQ